MKQGKTTKQTKDRNNKEKDTPTPKKQSSTSRPKYIGLKSEVARY